MSIFIWKKKSILSLPKFIVQELFEYICDYIFIPHATSCGGYNVFDPSVSQSVSQSVLFFLLAQLLWNRSTEFRETL